MEEIKLDVQVRNEFGAKRIRTLRHAGFIPAVVYGGKKKPTPVQVDRRVYEKIMRGHKGQSVIFHLNVMEGEKKLRDYSVILKDEQLDPVQDTLLHIDFQRISLKETIHVRVPLMAVGDPIGVKRDGGSLDQLMRELEIMCLPTNIPERIKFDVSQLAIGDSIHVKDLVLPNDVKTKTDPEALVASVAHSMKEEVAPPEGEPVLTEPEVLREKKVKEEGAGDEGKPKAEEKAKEKSEKKQDKKAE